MVWFLLYFSISKRGTCHGVNLPRRCWGVGIPYCRQTLAFCLDYGRSPHLKARIDFVPEGNSCAMHVISLWTTSPGAVFSLRRVRLNELQRWDPFAEIGHLAAAKICFADEADFFSCLFFSYVAPGQLDDGKCHFLKVVSGQHLQIYSVFLLPFAPRFESSAALPPWSYACAAGPPLRKTRKVSSQHR